MIMASKPMCEWTTMAAPRTASVTGLTEPTAKGATVRGIRATDMSCRRYGLACRASKLIWREAVLSQNSNDKIHWPGSTQELGRHH